MGSIDWIPIEQALDLLPFRLVRDDKPFKSYYPCLVYGPTWGGGWNHHPSFGGNFWTGEPRIAMAHTYEGQGYWVIDTDAPADYETYIQPSHFAEINAPDQILRGSE